jgi:hypothetical protein
MLIRPMHHQNFEIKVNKQVNKSIPIFSCISFCINKSPRLSISSKQLAPFKQEKGSVEFLLDKPIPYDLVKMIVKYRVTKNRTRGNK